MNIRCPLFKYCDEALNLGGIVVILFPIIVNIGERRESARDLGIVIY
jgi:hypothetical protein